MKTLLSLIALAAIGNAFADALDHWHWRNPLPTSLQLHDVAFGGGQFVAIGNGGWIVSSINGQDWTARSSGLQGWLNGIAYGDGSFLAYGYEETSGVFLTSPDGVTWNASTSAIAAWLRDVVYGQGLYVGVGEAGLEGPMIVTSPDGRNWTNQTSVPVLKRLNGIAFGNGTFAAVGDRGFIVTSPDGLNWSETASGTDRDLRGVIFGNGIFVAAGNRSGTSVILTSIDGMVWTPVWSLNTAAAPEPLTFLELDAVSYGAGVFVATGPGHAALTSVDGATWTEHDLGVDRVLEGIAYGNGYHAAVGWAVLREGIITSAVVSSADGSTWTDRTGGVPTLGVRGLAVGDGRYVTANERGKILTSTTGSNWSLTTELGITANLFGTTYANGLFLAVGREGNNGLLLVSSNGTQWTNRAPSGTPGLVSATYGNGRFLALRGSTVLWSTNGFDWAKTNSSSATNLNAVMFNEARFVGVGDKGTLQTSIDGLDWATQSSPTNSNFRGIAFGNGRYVAVGQRVIVSSADAVDWSISQTGGWDLQGVAFGGGTFVAVGFALSPYQRSFILTSQDGISWRARAVSSGGLLWSVAYDGQT
ncbi:MAG TPA: hypothetical protein DCE44_26395, partial [Verrucomicrobiales bacterium]|nr:hypothetical protein [Verrucomicrobiales bacterium]